MKAWWTCSPNDSVAAPMSNDSSGMISRVASVLCCGLISAALLAGCASRAERIDRTIGVLAHTETEAQVLREFATVHPDMADRESMSTFIDFYRTAQAVPATARISPDQLLPDLRVMDCTSYATGPLLQTTCY